MASDLEFREAFKLAAAIQADLDSGWLPPEEPQPGARHQLIAESLFRGTRGYLEKVVHQINRCYEQGCFDACNVMIRRLVETLIVEAFEHNRLTHKIVKPNGELQSLGDLVASTISEQSWTLTRNGRDSLRSLSKMKTLGDLSAHNRRFIAHANDVHLVAEDVRRVVQELLILAGIKYQ